jgi:hypothetical protein
MPRTPSTVSRVSVTAVCVVLVIIVLAGCRQPERVSPEPFPTSSFPTITVVPGMISPTALQSEIPRITPTEVWQRVQAGEAITIVDARSLAEYQIEHIVGAISLPAAEVQQRWDELPRDSLLVFYCT